MGGNRDEEMRGKVAGLEASILSRNPLVKLDISYNAPAGAMILHKIVVDPSARGTGVGTLVMQELCDAADEWGIRIALTPSADFGGSKSRLVGFYNGFGFKKVSRRSRDFSLSEEMIRDPQ